MKPGDTVAICLNSDGSLYVRFAETLSNPPFPGTDTATSPVANSQFGRSLCRRSLGNSRGRSYFWRRDTKPARPQFPVVGHGASFVSEGPAQSGATAVVAARKLRRRTGVPVAIERQVPVDFAE